MKDSDKYHKWVEWSDEDQVYIGKCPDLITGIHGLDRGKSETIVRVFGFLMPTDPAVSD